LSYGDKLSTILESFPWKKDRGLFDQAINLLTRRQYENWVIFRFGYELGDLEDVDLIFQGRYPDAILINVKTEEALRIEFEEYSSHFKHHKHDPKECDLIVCAYHDWKERFPKEKCPLPVYLVGSAQTKFFPKEE